MAKRPVFSTPPGSLLSSRSSRNRMITYGGGCMKISQCHPIDVNIVGSDVLSIEASVTELGCALDDQGKAIGKIVLCKIVNEETGEEDLVQSAHMFDGNIIQPYDGPWGVCPDVNANISKIDFICKCDDVNGDQTEIINYVTACYTTVCPDGTVEINQIGDFTDNSMKSTYTPINPSDCDDIGEDAMLREFVMCDNGVTFIRFLDILSGITIKNIGTNGQTYFPSGNEQFGSCDGNFNRIDYECKVDDVNSDGSVLNNFVTACYVTITPNGTSSFSSIGDFTDKSMKTPYTPLGNISIVPQEISKNETKQGRDVVENGTTWSPNQLMTEYTIRVSSIGNLSNPPIYTDSFGNQTTLEVGEVVTYSTNNILLDTSTQIQTFLGDRVVITYIS